MGDERDELDGARRTELQGKAEAGARSLSETWVAVWSRRSAHCCRSVVWAEADHICGTVEGFMSGVGCDSGWVFPVAAGDVTTRGLCRTKEMHVMVSDGRACLFGGKLHEEGSLKDCLVSFHNESVFEKESSGFRVTYPEQSPLVPGSAF